MKRANRRPAPALYTHILLACLLVLPAWTAANAQENTPPDAPSEVSREAAAPVPVQGPETDDRQGETGSTPAVDVMAPPMMMPAQSPPPFDRKKHDWIRLTSGEWLKGDIIVLRNDKFQFDSDEMDDLDFDWEDVAEVRSPRRYTYVFANRTSLIGTALITDKEVVLSVDGEERILKRSDLMSIVPAGTRERDRWDGKLSIGFAFRRGNTNQTDFTYQAFVRRRDALTRVRFDISGAVGEVDNEKTVNNLRSSLKLDIFASPRFYFTPLNLNFYHDKFQNISIQFTPSAGGGYHALKKQKAEIDLELAAGYQYTEYVSVEEGENRENRSGAIIPGIRIETDPLKDVDLDLAYQAAITVPKTEDTIMHGEVILSIEITRLFDLDVAWIWDRVQNPQENKDGTTPKKDDLKLTVGIGVDF